MSASDRNLRCYDSNFTKSWCRIWGSSCRPNEIRIQCMCVMYWQAFWKTSWTE